MAATTRSTRDVRSAFAPADGGVVSVGIDAPRGCPVELVDHLVEIARPHHVTDDPPAIGHDRAWLLVEVDPTLTEQLLCDRVERSGRHAFAETEAGESSPQLAGRLPGERQYHRVGGVGRAGGDPVGDTPREDASLARSRSGDHGDEL